MARLRNAIFELLDAQNPKGGLALVDEDEASFYLTVSRAALRSWRQSGTGPRHVRLGRRVKYRITDLDQWISQNSYPKARGSDAVEETDLGVTDDDITFLTGEK